LTGGHRTGGRPILDKRTGAAAQFVSHAPQLTVVHTRALRLLWSPE